MSKQASFRDSKKVVSELPFFYFQIIKLSMCISDLFEMTCKEIIFLNE